MADWCILRNLQAAAEDWLADRLDSWADQVEGGKDSHVVVVVADVEEVVVVHMFAVEVAVRDSRNSMSAAVAVREEQDTLTMGYVMGMAEQQEREADNRMMAVLEVARKHYTVAEQLARKGQGMDCCSVVAERTRDKMIVEIEVEEAVARRSGKPMVSLMSHQNRMDSMEVVVRCIVMLQQVGEVGVD